MRKKVLCFIIAFYGTLISLGVIADSIDYPSVYVKSFIIIFASFLSYGLFFGLLTLLERYLKFSYNAFERKSIKVIILLCLLLPNLSYHIFSTHYLINLKDGYLKDIQAHAEKSIKYYGVNMTHHCKEASDESFKIKSITENSWSFGDLNRSYKLVYRELQKYPVDFIRTINLDHIYLGTDLKNNNHNVGGLASYSGNFIAMDYSYDNNFNQTTFHHEVFHRIHHHFEDLDSTIFNTWENLNDPDFVYYEKLSGDALFYNNAEYHYKSRKGFASRYGKKNLDEDLAEVYSNLVSSKWHRDHLLESAEDDPILMKKIEFMHNFIKNTMNLKLIPGENMHFKSLPKPKLKDQVLPSNVNDSFPDL